MTKFYSGLGAIAAWLFCADARAEIKIVDNGGWTLSTDGRVNGFFSYARGESIPINAEHPVYPGGGVEDNTDNQNQVENFRVRSGFVSSVLNFNLKRAVSESVSMKVKMGLWWAVESKRTIDQSNLPDAREAWFKLEGPWGGLQVGRALALFSRGAIEIDFMYGHGNGLGHPCNNLRGQGPACGHVGHGVQYPGFSAGVVYNTPSIGGFTLTAGVYDPLTLPGLFDRTPLPRTEGELVYDLIGSGDDNLHVFVNGVWQRMVQEGRPSAPRTTLAADPWGVGYGIRGQAGFFKAGLASHYGRGLGLSYPLENTPTVAVNPGGNADVPGAYTLRMFDGYYAQVMVTFGNTDLAAGAGISRVKATEFDANANLLKSQRGLSLGLYEHVDKVVFAVEYFRGDYTWLMGDHQGMNFYNIGATVLW